MTGKLSFVSRTIIAAVSIEPRWLAYGFAYRNFQLYTAQGRKAGTNGTREIGWTIRSLDRFAQDETHFLLHGTPVAGCPYAQPCFHVVVKIADRNARHNLTIRCLCGSVF